MKTKLNALFSKPIDPSQVVAFVQQLGTMIDAGIPLTKCLAALERQEEHPEFRSVLRAIRADVESGVSLSIAFSKHPKVISHFMTSMVVAGEHGVGLSQVLYRIAHHLEKEQMLRTQIKQVFTYPLIIGGFSLLIIGVLIIFVAPVFSRIYSQLGLSLPLSTRTLLATSDFVRTWWIAIIGSVAGGFVTMRVVRNQRLNSDVFYRIVDAIPGVRELFRRIAITKFIRSFSSLLVCHVPMLESLSVVKRIVEHPQIQRVVQHLQYSVQTGRAITTALQETGIFSPVVLQMSAVGEESGELGPLLEKCAEGLEEDLNHYSKRVVVIIEPVLTIVLAGIVGFIALAIYLPMFDMMTQTGA